MAQPCLEIQKDINKSYDLTRRWNLCAVITDGSAVLGLGDIGPEAGMPVMEGKCVLFKACLLYTSPPVCVESTAVGSTAVSRPHTDKMGSAAVSEHCPTQEISCTLKMRRYAITAF